MTCAFRRLRLGNRRDNLNILQQARALSVGRVLAVAGADGSLGRIAVDGVFFDEPLLFRYQRHLTTRNRRNAQVTSRRE